MFGGDLIEILFFAAIAAVVVFKLRGVLGRRTGHEPPPNADPFGARGEDAAGGKVVRLPSRHEPDDDEDEDDAPARKPVAGPPGVAAIQEADRDFDPDGFLEGAQGAFEMIVGAFAAGDKDALRPLLSDEVMRGFTQAIDDRASRAETLDTTIMRMLSATIDEAELQGRTAFVTVRFESEQVNVVKDSEGRIIEGDPAQAERIVDMWTFARNTRATDPNWTLVSTEAPDDEEPAAAD